jgi:hypothetical protein
MVVCRELGRLGAGDIGIIGRRHGGGRGTADEPNCVCAGDAVYDSGVVFHGACCHNECSREDDGDG